MKSIKIIHDLVKYLAGKNLVGSHSPADIDRLTYNACLVFLDQLLAEYSYDQSNNRHLDPLRTKTEIQLVKGLGAFPSECYHVRYVTDKGNDAVVWDEIKEIHYKYEQSRVVGKRSKLNPAFYIPEHTKIQALPKDAGTKEDGDDKTSIDFYYFKKPVYPEYKFTLNELDQYVYNDDESIDISFSEHSIPEISMLVLKGLSANIRDSDLRQYIQEVRNDGK